jgi:hypothetical protein
VEVAAASPSSLQPPAKPSEEVTNIIATILANERVIMSSLGLGQREGKTTWAAAAPWLPRARDRTLNSGFAQKVWFANEWRSSVGVKHAVRRVRLHQIDATKAALLAGGAL